MRRILVSALAALLTVSLVLPAFAVGLSDPTELVKSVKGRIDIPAEYTEFESEKSIQRDGETLYFLRWFPKEDQDSGSLSVSVSSRGDITEIYIYKGRENYDKKGIAGFSAEDYAKKAEAFVRRANPKLSEELNFDVLPDISGIYSNAIYIKFPRVVNGIPFEDEGITVELDKYTGEPISQRAFWTYVKNIPDPEGIIGEDEAIKSFGELSGMKLQYMKKSGTDTAALVYSLNMRDLLVDASSGERFEIKPSDEVPKVENGAADSASPEAAGRLELTEEELASLAELEGLLSENRISEIIKRLANTAIQSCDISSISYEKHKVRDEDKYFANVSLQSKDGRYAYAYLDAVSGEVLSFYASEDVRNKKKTKNTDSMRASAELFISSIVPDIAGKVHDFSDTPSGGYFRYSRSENGIELVSEGISISVSEYTGKILSYQKNWDYDTKFESPDGIISSEEALSAMFKKTPIKLTYIALGARYASASVSENAALVYKVSEKTAPYISAKNGDALGYDLEPQKDKQSGYILQDDVKKHFSAEAVAALATNGIIVSDEELFKPDEVISQSEAELLLKKLDGGYVPLRGEGNGEFVKGGGKSLLREDALGLLVRALGYGKAAEIKGIYNIDFKDADKISADRVGYVAIGRGLGIVSGDGVGNFNPKKGVTRGEFSVMLYNALKNAK